MTSYKTTAIIIGRLNLGESDRILTLFSPGLGIIRAIAKGSRRTKSKFSGHTELFTLGDFVISGGKNLDIITDVSLKENYMTKSPDMESIKSAYYFAEIIIKLLPGDEPHPEIFDLLTFCLANYGVLGDELTRLIFVARILKTLGIYPELDICVKCNEKPTESNLYFSKTAGGIACRDCSVHFADAERTSEEVIKLWRFVADSPISRLTKLHISGDILVPASDLAIEYIQCVTQIDYRSLRVLS